MTGRMQDKTVLVTGAARGTGRETAALMAAEGASVWLLDIRDDMGEAAAAELADQGLRAQFRHLDVTQPDDWAAAVRDVVAADGRVDALVNNAAALHVAALLDHDDEIFDRLLRVNVTGPFLGIKTVAPHMIEQGGGSVVNVASIDGLQSNNGVAAYSSSKFGLRGLTKTAAIELGQHGIRVNAVCPSGGSFEMSQPFFGVSIDLEAAAKSPQRSMLPDGDASGKGLTEIAEMILFLASDASSGCTGGDYPVDRGQTAGKRIDGMPG